MTWDIENFLNRMRGGFDSGEQKRVEEEKLVQQQQQDEEKKVKQAQDDERKEQMYQLKTEKEQLSIIEKVLKMFGLDDKKPSNSKSEKEYEDEITEIDDNEAKMERLKSIAELAKKIKTGLDAYGQKVNFENPLATMSGEMATSAIDNNLPDPYLQGVMNIMETGGSRNLAQPNNYFNWGSNPKPDINTAITRMAEGVGNQDGLYKDYLQSRDMADFFKVYTPETDPNNPALDTLLGTYSNIKNKYFPK